MPTAPLLATLRCATLATLFCALTVPAGIAQEVRTGATTLPDLATLTLQSDFTQFMHRDVPEEVRRRALRKLWVLIELPWSCYELCYTLEPAVADPRRLASGQISTASRQ